MDSAPNNDPTPSLPGSSAIYFDGLSNQRRAVSLGFMDALEISGNEARLAAWPYSDIRRADGPSGILRLTCLGAPLLARLEIRDAAVAAELISRCARLDEDVPGRRGVAAIVGWSLAAAVSIVAMVLFGLPLAADRLTPLMPQAFERRSARSPFRSGLPRMKTFRFFASPSSTMCNVAEFILSAETSFFSSTPCTPLLTILVLAKTPASP